MVRQPLWRENGLQTCTDKTYNGRDSHVGLKQTDLYGKNKTTYGGESHFGLKQTQTFTHETRNGRDSHFGVKQRTDLYGQTRMMVTAALA